MTLRIFNGDAAIGGFREAFGKDESTDVLVCRDVLICGPVSQFTTIEKWRAGRESFWGSLLEGLELSPVLTGDDPSDVSFLSKWRDLYADTEELKAADEIEVWIGCALSDQILLAFVAFLIDLYDIDPGKLSVVQMRKRDGWRILGIGELKPDAIRAHPAPRGLTKDEFDYCLDVWQAVTAETPGPLLAELAREHAPLPLMRAALNALRYRFPDSRTGLSLWDQLLLETAVDPGRKASRIVGYSMSATWDGSHPAELDSVGDWYLFHRLRNLALPRLAEPLAESSALNAPMGFAEYKQTETGRAVLAGKRNAIDINGIDDWICGVHLSSAIGNVWVRDGDAIVPRSG